MMNRRYFFVRGLSCLSQGILGLATANWILSACSNSSSPYGNSGTPIVGGNCDANGTQLETTGVTESHTHTIEISAGAIVAANAGAVFVTSNSFGHTHNVQLTSAQYAQLQANQGVGTFTAGGGTDGHVHSVTFNCA